ncbi:MAG: PD-(D/E)XK nuclease family protein [Fervidobacterium sp.]
MVIVWDDILRNLDSLLNSGRELKHGFRYIFVSDVAQQFYCEKKVENTYTLGGIPTEAKVVGSVVHDEVFRMEKVELHELIEKIKSGERVVASFTLVGMVNGIPLVGKPDAVLFFGQRPLFLIELKTTSSSVSKLWDDQTLQAQVYAYLLEEMGFDVSSLRIFIVKVRREIGENERKSLLNQIVGSILQGNVNERRGFMKIFEIKYDREYVVRQVSWALGYWLNERDAIPTRKASKCRACEYNAVCKFSLAH